MYASIYTDHCIYTNMWSDFDMDMYIINVKWNVNVNI